MKKNVKQKLNEYRCDNLTLHFIETDYDGRNYYYDDNGEHYVGRGGTPEHPLYLTTAYGDGWEPDLEVECDNVNVLMESKRKIKRINESQLKTIIAESVKMVLKENDFVNGKLNPFQSPEVRQSINARHQTKSTCGNRNKVQVTNTVKPNGMPLNGTAKKYFYSKEEAEQMGYKPTGWADISGWIYQNEKGDVVHVKRDWSRIKIKESKLKTIVSESIKKVLRESTNDFHHTEVGENPLMKGRYGVHSIPYGDMGHFDGTLQQCKDYAPEMEKAAEERFQKDIQHAIEMGMSEEEMNKILHDTYSRRGKYIPSVNNGNVSWNEK